MDDETPPHKATVSDLYDVDGQAELIDGQIADAEPAVPNWTIAVDEVFGPIAPG